MIITAQDGKQYDVASNSKFRRSGFSVMLCGETIVIEVGHYKSERAAQFVKESANANRRRHEDYKMPSAEEAEVEWRAAREKEVAQEKERLRRTREIVWIPVEERFPNIDEWVLVTADNGEDLCVFEAWCDEDQCWRENSGKALSGYVEVIAWAEMPEPYKCKDEREEEN